MVIRTAFQQAALIDTSAVITLHDPSEPRHEDVRRVFSAQRGLFWAVLDVTSHECYTRVRYKSTFQAAMEHYSFMRDSNFKLLRFESQDEVSARGLLERYSDQAISFHDALCAVVMKRVGIYRVFTLDRDFAVLGFETIPGAFFPKFGSGLSQAPAEA